MDKHKKNMDDFFRENLSDFELSKKEGNWKLLNHLLNEQEKKRKKRKLFFLFFSILIILTSALYILLPGIQTAEISKDKLVQSNITAAIENKDLKNKSNEPVATTSINKNEIANSTTNNDVKIKSANNEAVSHLKIKAVTNALNANASDQNIENSINTTNSANIQTGTYQVSPLHDIHAVDSGQNSNNQFSISDNHSANNWQSNDSANKDSILPLAENESLVASNSTDTKTDRNDSLNAIATSLSLADSPSVKQVSPKNSFLNFNLYAGINIYSTSNAFNNQGNISPVAGLEFAPAINSKLSIGLACLYSLQGGYHLYDTATTTEKTYFLDVSENISEQTVQTHHLHKLYFPLTIYYAVAKRHSVSAAIQLSYLVNTKSNYAESYTTAGITNQSQKKNVKGYMDGIKPTTVSVSAGYQFSLSKTLAVSGRITRELTSSYISDYFSGVNTNPSWSYQTFLIVKF